MKGRLVPMPFSKKVSENRRQIKFAGRNQHKVEWNRGTLRLNRRVNGCCFELSQLGKGTVYSYKQFIFGVTGVAFILFEHMRSGNHITLTVMFDSECRSCVIGSFVAGDFEYRHEIAPILVWRIGNQGSKFLSNIHRMTIGMKTPNV